MSRYVLALCTTLVLTACTFTPQEGEWIYTTDEVVENTCDDSITEGGGTLTLAVTESGDLVIDPEDGSDPFQCTLSGKDFTCVERLAGEESTDGVDATVSYRVSATGTFASPTEASGTQSGTADCEGDSCAQAEAFLGITFPCTVTEDFTIVHAP